MNRRTVVISIAMLIVGVVIGIGLMQIGPVYSSVQSALGKENTLNYIGDGVPPQGMAFQNYLNTGDLEALMMAVQSERVRLLDAQLIDLVKAVQAKNELISKLNQLLFNLYNVSGYYRSDAKDDEIIRPSWFERMQSLYLNGTKDDPLPGGLPQGAVETSLTQIHLLRVELGLVNFHYKTKGELDKAIQTIKSRMDSLSNEQQMDMLRLQALNNKKNESIEILTNTQKKHSDSKSNIIRNMR